MTGDLRTSDAGSGANRRSLAIGLTVALVFAALDQATKQVAESLLELGEFVSLYGEHIGWQLVYNQGGAFGVGAPHWLFLIVTVIVFVVVVRALPRTPSRLTATAYGLLLAGAVGNVIDRLFRAPAPTTQNPADFGGGAVVDFVAWGTFPRFNVADSAITVGFVLLVIALWAEERRATRHDDGGLQAIAAAIGVTPRGPGSARDRDNDGSGDEVGAVPDEGASGSPDEVGAVPDDGDRVASGDVGPMGDGSPGPENAQDADDAEDGGDAEDGDDVEGDERHDAGPSR